MTKAELLFSLDRGRQRPSAHPVSALIEKHSVPVSETGCWLWLGAIDKHGYGTRRIGRRGQAKNYFAHRLSFEAYIGAADGKLVLHSCDTPSCVNPAHLRLGTQADNMADMCAKGRHWRMVNV